MKKKSIVSVTRVVFLLILLCLLLTGCGCKHEWLAATCTAPKTCSVCQTTEGEALGHAWADASCEAPKTCSVCNTTEGEALGHTWVDATTETPKTCSVCQKTEGERIITDTRFKTAACKDLFGTWSGVIEIPGNTIVDENFNGTLKIDYTIIFKNDGTYQEITKLINKEEFDKSVEEYYVDAFYKQFASQGIGQAQADEAMIATYGMNVRDYSKKLASAFNWDTIFAAELNGVYFVAEDGKLHSGSDWNLDLTIDSYTISGNTLSIETLTKEFPDLALTRS